MKKIGFYNFYDIYNNNRIFNPEIQAPIGDDLLYPFHYLAKARPETGIYPFQRLILNLWILMMLLFFWIFRET